MISQSTSDFEAYSNRFSPSGKTKSIVCFGEIMTRFSSPECYRMQQVLPGRLDVSFAGAEANIAASIAVLGGHSKFVSALPANAIGESCVRFLNSFGIDTSGLIRSSSGRMPSYYIERGVAQRPTEVLYDRDGSSFSLTEGRCYAWDDILADASWLVISGISPGLSKIASEATLHAVKKARKKGVIICCDLNFRNKLWNWEPGTRPRDLARRVMGDLTHHVDVLITNPDQAHDVLGIPRLGCEATLGGCTLVAEQIADAYPNLRQIVFTLRENISASHNEIGAFHYTPATGEAILAPGDENAYEPYTVNPIVDRIGAGDAFAAGFIHALHTPSLNNPFTAISFGVAASCLAHSVPGDINFASQQEILNLLQGDRSGRVIR